jgi:adenylate cyclase
MPEDSEISTTTTELGVLFADISGSTKLYEEHGDDLAREAVARCVEVMVEVVENLEGRVVKTIGDEVMCVFQSPVKAVMAGTDLQGAVRKASEAGEFVTGPLRIKVGLHWGTGIEEEDDVFGEAANVAQGLIKMAKADQVLTSQRTVDGLPDVMRMGVRFFDRTPVDGAADDIDVFELIWEVGGLTQVADTRPTAPRTVHERLVLEYRGEHYQMDEGRPSITLGRVDGNDIVVPTGLTSRSHAQIEYRRGRFYLSDNSANGTNVVGENGQTTSLRRDQMALDGCGRICLGGGPETNPDGVISFSCE